MTRTLLALMLLASLSLAAMAHDCWIVPEKYIMKPGEIIKLDIRTGMIFPESLNEVELERLHFFHIYGEDDYAKIENLKIVDLATRAGLSMKDAGSYVIVAAIKPSIIELNAADFNEYLLSDGLTHIYEQRKAAGIVDEDAVEEYSKYPKAIIQVGDRISEAPIMRIGTVAELVPMVNPYSLHEGDTLPVMFLFRGDPMPGEEVAWTYAGFGAGYGGSAVTDDKGIANIPLSTAGPFVIRAIHMEKIQAQTHNWESYWASCSFEVQKKVVEENER